jgi:hypothetical protein
MRSEIGLLTKDENRNTIPQALLYPLRFEPIYQYRPWGGRPAIRSGLFKQSLPV